MLKKDMLAIEKYFEGILIIFLLAIFIYIIKGFLMAIFLAGTLVFLTYKPYQKLVKKTKNETISALFILFLIISCILLPTYLIGVSLVKEATHLIYSSSNLIDNINLENCNYEFCSTIENNLELLKKYLDINYLFKNFGSSFLNSFGIIFDSVTTFFINFFIFILAFFFMLKDGDKLMQFLKRVIPMKTEYKEALFLRFKQVSVVVFYDSIFIAIMQGTLLGIGFWIAKMSSPIFWGAIASFFALIPMVGTAIVWVPSVIYLIFTGNYFWGIFLILYCSIVVGLSDNVIRTLLLNKKMHVHPFLIFISVLGGLEVFGFFGLFLGPIIISLLISVFQLYKLDFK